VAENQDQEPVGVVFITYDATNVLLTRLAVLPEYQGKGIGTELVEEAEQILEDREVPVSVAFAESGNKELKQWYRNMGYHEKGDYTMMWKNLN
jgi:ribosomal protein S18 acetylase RimI-like enzyme